MQETTLSNERERQEEVVLVNEQDEPMGVMEKMEAHKKALLHRAFSVFIFNSKGEMLLQQRALQKYHSAGLWTNACCSHPRPGEDTRDAAMRRLQEELGFTAGLKKVFDFVYRSEFENGLTEFEFDHVFVGIHDGEIHPDRDEVVDYRFVSPEEIRADLESHPTKYTAWFRLAFPMVVPPPFCQ
jgi:isopentenyl-diphosphate Delta-isomerase